MSGEILSPGSPVEGKDGSSKATNCTQLSSMGHSLGGELGAAEGSLVRWRLEVWDWMPCITKALCLEGFGKQ